MLTIMVQALIAGLGTLLGASLILFFREMKPRAFSFLLALASGIMICVVITDLIPYSIKLGGIAECLLGFFSGLLIISIADIMINLHTGNKQGQKGSFLGMGYLIALGIALHDLPEGLAIAAGYSGPGTIGPVIALAIGLHNIPEGMATAAPLKAGGATSKKILGLNTAVSLVTPLGTLLGLLIINISSILVSNLLGFAAGAMSYIVLSKLIPSTRKQLKKSIYIPGILTGFLMMFVIKLFFE